MRSARRDGRDGRGVPPAARAGIVVVSVVPGRPWGSPADGPPDAVVEGDDAALAAAVRAGRPGMLVQFEPADDSDLAHTLGLRAGMARRGVALPMDVLELADERIATNVVVLGHAPDHLRATDRSTRVTLQTDRRVEAFDAVTTVVLATGQWLRNTNLVPRGHPGDGRAEVHVYRLARRERRPMRVRLPTGVHLPHPRIVTRTAVEIDVRAARPLPLEIDGRPAEATTTVRCRLLPARYRLLV